MADTKISGLPTAGALDGTEAFPLVQSGATRQSTIGAIRIPDHPGYVSGYWYLMDCAAVGTVTAAAARVGAAPSVIRERVTLTALAINVTTGVAGGVILGIYANDRGKPGARIAETTTGSTGTAAAVSLAFAAPVTLEPGIYWFVWLFEAAPTVSAVAGADVGRTAVLGRNTPVWTGYSCRNIDAAYPDLPAQWGGAPGSTFQLATVISFKVA